MSKRFFKGKVERDSARRQLMATVAETRDRLSPVRLKADLTAGAKAKAQDVAKAAKSRPAVVATTVAGLALILFRKPLFAALKRLSKEK